MERLRDSHILVHSTDAQHRQGRDEAGNQELLPRLAGGRGSSSRATSCYFSRALVGSWVRSGVART